MKYVLRGLLDLENMNSSAITDFRSDAAQAWMTLHNVTDMESDDDGDGVKNLIEFGLGGDPHAEDAADTAPA